MMSAAQAEPKKSSDTDSWGTSCLSPPFVVTAFCHRLFVTAFSHLSPPFRTARVLFSSKWEGIRIQGPIHRQERLSAAIGILSPHCSAADWRRLAFCIS